MAKNPPPPPPQPEQQPPDFPILSAYIESASPEQLKGLFDDLKGALTSLKGPKADHAKKANKAVGRTEELLGTLMQVREKLETDAKGKRKK